MLSISSGNLIMCQMTGTIKIINNKNPNNIGNSIPKTIINEYINLKFLTRKEFGSSSGIWCKYLIADAKNPRKKEIIKYCILIW